MAKIWFRESNFRSDTLNLIDQVNAIATEYAGYDLTLRSIYYQLVARNIVPNNERSYKRLIDVVRKGRDAGLIDWDSVIDRTRKVTGRNHWQSVKHLLGALKSNWHLDMWENQPNRVWVLCEKAAQEGVVSKPCYDNDVPYFICRGYASATSIFTAARTMKDYADAGQQNIVLYGGDHDPSGLDMVNDVLDRLNMYSETYVEVRHIALTMDQIDQYGPPPNPAKLTDSRSQAYIAEHGRSSWELDALAPEVYRNLLNDEISDLRDDTLWAEMEAKKQAGYNRISQIMESL